MTDTDKPQGVSVMPSTVPIPNVKVLDPRTAAEREDQDVNDSATGHEAFERAKAETERRQ